MSGRVVGWMGGREGGCVGGREGMRKGVWVCCVCVCLLLPWLLTLAGTVLLLTVFAYLETGLYAVIQYPCFLLLTGSVLSFTVSVFFSLVLYRLVLSGSVPLLISTLLIIYWCSIIAT